RIMESRKHPELGYRSCLGVLRLGERYGRERLETACRRAVALNACSYRRIKSMLETGLDRQPLEPVATPAAPRTCTPTSAAPATTERRRCPDAARTDLREAL